MVGQNIQELSGFDSLIPFESMLALLSHLLQITYFLHVPQKKTQNLLGLLQRGHER